MSNKFFFNKKRVGFGLIVFIMFNVISIWFINNPEIFIRNFLIKKEHIQIIGFIMFTYSMIMIYSFITLLFCKKIAFIISHSYLIDNSTYGSIGKVYFSEILKIKRLKKNSLEIVLKEPIFESRRLNILKKIILMANNWKYKNSIIVSSALLHNCDIISLEKAILAAIEKNNTEPPADLGLQPKSSGREE